MKKNHLDVHTLNAMAEHATSPHMGPSRARDAMAARLVDEHDMTEHSKNPKLHHNLKFYTIERQPELMGNILKAHNFKREGEYNPDLNIQMIIGHGKKEHIDEVMDRDVHHNYDRYISKYGNDAHRDRIIDKVPKQGISALTFNYIKQFGNASHMKRLKDMGIT